MPQGLQFFKEKRYLAFCTFNIHCRDILSRTNYYLATKYEFFFIIVKITISILTAVLRKVQCGDHQLQHAFLIV